MNKTRTPSTSQRQEADVSAAKPPQEQPLLLKSPLFESFSSLSHAFTTRRGGTSPPPFDTLNLSSKTGDNEKHVKKNISLLKDQMGIKSDLFMLNQVHGSDVLLVDNMDLYKGEDPSFDAMITDKPEIPLTILTADCTPLLIYDPSKKAIAAVHAGWKGTAGGISGNTIDMMSSAFGSDPSDLVIAMGPSIGPCCYEVDKRVFESFTKCGYNWTDISTRVEKGEEARWMLDLAQANFIQLAAKGIQGNNISLPPHCTACRKDLFYSHRRDGKQSGREAAVIMMKGN